MGVFFTISVFHLHINILSSEVALSLRQLMGDRRDEHHFWEKYEVPYETLLDLMDLIEHHQWLEYHNWLKFEDV